MQRAMAAVWRRFAWLAHPLLLRQARELVAHNSKTAGELRAQGKGNTAREARWLRALGNGEWQDDAFYTIMQWLYSKLEERGRGWGGAAGGGRQQGAKQEGQQRQQQEEQEQQQQRQQQVQGKRHVEQQQQHNHDKRQVDQQPHWEPKVYFHHTSRRRHKRLRPVEPGVADPPGGSADGDGGPAVAA